MSDERFDDAIHDALLADDPGAVPVRLKARMAMIPDETAGQVTAMGRRTRAMNLAFPAAVLAALVVVALAFGGIALRGQQTATAVSSFAPRVSAQASAPGASSPAVEPTTSVEPSIAAASPSPNPQPSGPIVIDASTVVGLSDGTFALKGTMSYYRWVSDTVSDPLLGYRDLSNSENAKSVVFLQNGHDIADHAITDAGFVWIETWYTQKPIDCGGRTGCGEHQGQPISWALNLTSLDGKTTRLDSGAVSRIDIGGEGASASPPTMTAQGDRVAYAVPRTTRGLGLKPEASRIIVRSLSGLSILRTVDTNGYIAQLALYGESLAYREANDDGVHPGADPSDATLRLYSSDAQRTPVVLGEHVQQLGIGADGTGDVQIAWTTSQPDDATIHTSTADGSTQHVVPPTSPAMSNGYSPEIVGDGFVWLAQQQDAQGAWSTVVLAWRPGWDNARTVPDLGSPDWIGSSDGKLLFGGMDVPVLKRVGDGQGIPMGAIGAAHLLGG